MILGRWFRPVLVIAWFGLLYWQETRHPLRRSVEPRPRRVARNSAMAALSGITLSLLEQPAATRMSGLVERRRWGAVLSLNLPRPLERAVVLLLLDYTLYVWHVLTHRVPALWRMHRVHHIDLDLDVSTALRFHALEMAVSVLWRVSQIVLIGVRPPVLRLWQLLTLLSVAFHHSNIRLPLGVEERLKQWIITPRLHGIHHSNVPDETNSNWSSGLTVWDRLHGTLRTDIPQETITIGVPGFRTADDVRLGTLILLPCVASKEPDAR